MDKRGQSPNSQKNLVKNKFVKGGRPQDKKIQSKGGKASAEKQKQNKTIKEFLNLALNLGAQKNVKEAAEMLGIKNENITNSLGIAIRLMDKALNGDFKSIEKCMELEGAQTSQINQNQEIVDAIKNSMDDVWK